MRFVCEVKRKREEGDLVVVGASARVCRKREEERAVYVWVAGLSGELGLQL